MHSGSEKELAFRKIAASLKPIDLADAGVSDDCNTYFRYYNIDFEEQFENVTHHFGKIDSGQHQIATHLFRQSSAAGTCFILHGYYDHAGLFKHLIRYCLNKNFSVVIFDLPGHGMSSGAAATIAEFSEYQQVLTDILSRFKDEVPKPWHALGQSTGGAILSEFLLRENSQEKKGVFDKAVLIAPLIYPVRWAQSLLGYYLSRYFINEVPRSFVDNSHDTEFLLFLKNRDPLQARSLPLQWVGSLRRWIAQFLALAPSDKKILIVQGEDDGTVDWKKNMPLFKQRYPNANIHQIAKAKHQLVNESEEIRDEMFAAIDAYFSDDI